MGRRHGAWWREEDGKQKKEEEEEGRRKKTEEEEEDDAETTETTGLTEGSGSETTHLGIQERDEVRAQKSLDGATGQVGPGEAAPMSTRSRKMSTSRNTKEGMFGMCHGK